MAYLYISIVYLCKLDHVKSKIYVPCCRFVSWDCCSGYEKQNGERGCTER